MELRRKGTIYIALTTALLAFSTNVRAAHATNFLNGLHQNITNRLATDTNLSRPEDRALANAARTLERNSATLPADLKLLATASSQLKAKFSDDEELTELQTDAVTDYSDVARSRMNLVHIWINTNSISKPLSNQVAKAEAALDRADGVSNSVPAQARALAFAFEKILPVERKVRALYPAPTVPPPPPPGTNSAPDYVPPPAVAAGSPGLAPDTFGTKHVDLSENAVVNEQTKFYFSTATTGAQIYDVHYPEEELGLWYYV